MNRVSIILLLFLGTTVMLQAQSMVGLAKETVRVVMQEDVKEFRIDKTVTRQQFNYLKYVNNIRTKTLIIFFSEDDICTKTKLICDYSEYDDMLDELKEKCKRVSPVSWEYQHEDNTYLITLEELEWYFVLREVEKEDQKDSTY